MRASRGGHSKGRPLEVSVVLVEGAIAAPSSSLGPRGLTSELDPRIWLRQLAAI